jgi:hypothetical protein
MKRDKSQGLTRQMNKPCSGDARRLSMPHDGTGIPAGPFRPPVAGTKTGPIALSHDCNNLVTKP